MSQIVTAVYENGVLRPLQPLPLVEHQMIRLQLLPEAPNNPVDEIIDLMVTAGLTPARTCLDTPRSGIFHRTPQIG